MIKFEDSSNTVNIPTYVPYIVTCEVQHRVVHYLYIITELYSQLITQQKAYSGKIDFD